MINGIINVYKEPGFTSHDVVAKLRGIAGQRKIGHTGTLDPDAEGVLPVCLGRATKVCDLLANDTKTYEAVLLLGVTTDTQDTSGRILRERTVSCTEEDFRAAVSGFLGDQMQIPPMYSAIKKDGKKLYELARQGKEVEREARPVHFFEISLLRWDPPRAVIRVTCSKGTYIRTLCHDIGEALGCGGCMEHLTRTRVGIFDRSGAKKLSELQAASDAGNLAEHVMPVDALFRDLPEAALAPEQDAPAHNGNRLELSGQEAPSRRDRADEDAAGPGRPASARIRGAVRIYDSAGAFVGLYERAGSSWKPLQMFYDPEN